MGNTANLYTRNQFSNEQYFTWILNSVTGIQDPGHTVIIKYVKVCISGLSVINY